MINVDKSVLHPTKRVDFLGFTVTASGNLSLTEVRFRKLHAQGAKLLSLATSNRRFVPFRLLRQFLGVAVASFDAIKLARVQCHHMFACLKEYERRYRHLPTFSDKFGVSYLRVKLSTAALRSLKYWVSL